MYASKYVQHFLITLDAKTKYNLNSTQYFLVPGFVEISLFVLLDIIAPEKSNAYIASAKYNTTDLFTFRVELQSRQLILYSETRHPELINYPMTTI